MNGKARSEKTKEEQKVEKIKKRINFETIKYEVEQKPGLLSGLILKYLEKRKNKKTREHKNKITQKQENTKTPSTKTRFARLVQNKQKNKNSLSKKTQFDGANQKPHDLFQQNQEKLNNSLRQNQEKPKKSKRKNLLLKLLFLIPGRRRISVDEYYMFSERDRIIYLAYFFGKKIPRILTTFFLILLLAISLVLFKRDISKKPTYDQVRPNDYKDIEWNEKADNQGYSYYSDDKASFKWRAVIIPPNKSYLKKVLDISQIHLHIKDLKGQIEIPAYVRIKEKGIPYSTQAEKKIIKDVEELTLLAKTHFASFLGLSFVSPSQGNTITINGKKFNIATIQIPKDSKIIKVGDGLYPAGVYKIDNFSYLFHNFTAPAIVYYQPIYHLIIQLILVFFAILGFVLTFLIVKRIRLPSIQLKTRHFFYLFLAMIFLIILFSALFPNPRSIILNWDNRNISYETENFLVSDKQIPNYLWWVLAFTRSIDAMIIGDTNIGNCGESRYRHFYLTKFSVQKFIVLEEFKDNACAKLVTDMSPQKVVVVPQNKVENELTKLKNRSYFLDFAFIFNIKTIFILSNLLIFMASAFLVWKAFTIKRIKDVFLLIIYGISFFFGLTFLFILVGALAHMPIGYHGINNLGLIMSNYALPGVFRGGNNLRTLFAFLGCFSAVIFFTDIKRKISLLVYPFFVLVLVLIFIIPKTEYYAKRFVLTGIAAEAYVWDYKIDAFNSFDLYRSIRDNEAVQYIKHAFSRRTAAGREMLFAYTLRKEFRFGEATKVYKEIIVKYKDLKDLVAQAHFELGELYFEQRTVNILNKKLQELEIVQPKDFYLRQAISEYTKAINLAPHARFVPRAEYRLILSYRFLKEFGKSSIYCFQFLNKYPKSTNVPEIELTIADNYLRQGDYENAIQSYKNFIKKYPEKGNIPRLKADLAYAHYKLGQKEKAFNLYYEIISENPDDLSLIASIYIRLQFMVDYKTERPLLNKALGAFNLELAEQAYLKAIDVYNDLEGKFPTQIFNINNIFRKAETYKKLSEKEDVLEKKKEYWALAEKEYNKILKNFPKTNFATLARARLKKIEIEKKEKIGIKISYDLGEGAFAFDNENVLYPRKEMHLAGSLRIEIPHVSSACGNKVCEIGENPTNCPKDCKLGDNQIIIRARGQKAKDAWPKMQLWLEQRLIKEWEINNQDFKNFQYTLELPQRPVHLDIVYSNDDQSPAKEDRSLIIDQVLINDRSIPLTSIPEIVVPAPKEAPPKGTPTIIENLKSKFLAYIDKINIFKQVKKPLAYPPDHKSLWQIVHPSRGISLYFAGVVALFMALLLRRNFRTFVSPLLFFMISRGIIRVAEQDPFRAWYSIPEGVITGVQLVIILFITNIILFILANPLKLQIKLKEIKNITRSKEKPKEKLQKLSKMLKPKI